MRYAIKIIKKSNFLYFLLLKCYNYIGDAMKPIISVIIPCYNVEKYLNKCLDSVLNNTFKDIEVIAIDDGSKDSTYEILKEYEKKDSRMIISTKKNTGQANTRNIAINKANGDYILFLDSDDYIDIDMLDKLYNKASKGFDIVVCDAKGIDENGNILNTIVFNEYTNDNIKNYIVNSSGPCWKLIKSSIVKDNKLTFYENHIYEDVAVVPAWGVYANSIGYVSGTYYYYLIRNNSTMNQVSYNKKLEDIFDSLDNLSKLFDNKYSEELEYIYIDHLLHAASLRFFKFNKLDMIDKIVKIMNDRFPNWNKNSYFKKQGIKYKIVCNLFYRKKYKLLKLILKK